MVIDRLTSGRAEDDRAIVPTKSLYIERSLEQKRLRQWCGTAMSRTFEHKTEIDTSESTESEATGFQEIQNPNDHLAVTYVFCELQRTHKISEKLRALTPVILANDFPGAG
jgi:hypothetical protein